MVIRCLVKREGELFVAMSLEFGLAAQANSLDEAKSKLEAQVDEYLEDAYTVDSAYRKQLLSRKGPKSWFVIYHIVKAAHSIRGLRDRFGSFFDINGNGNGGSHHHASC
ncbi:hypothetical protein [Vibrio astriarenae]|uniref:hypothetical protein n=1 Tax=Vibrio astriarenae TaxID=1481923 RepID=UPI003734D274